jgi:archaellum component FlaC
MPDNMQPLFDVLLGELRETRAELRGEIQAIRSELQRSNERVTTVETNLKPLLPNGTKGKIAEMSEAIHRLEGWRWYVIGISTGASAVIGLLLHQFMR